MLNDMTYVISRHGAGGDDAHGDGDQRSMMAEKNGRVNRRAFIGTTVVGSAAGAAASPDGRQVAVGVGARLADSEDLGTFSRS